MEELAAQVQGVLDSFLKEKSGAGKNKSTSELDWGMRPREKK